MNFRVQVFDRDGALPPRVRPARRRLRRLRQAERASRVDSDGHVYVVEGLNDVVQIFDDDGPAAARLRRIRHAATGSSGCRRASRSSTTSSTWPTRRTGACQMFEYVEDGPVSARRHRSPLLACVLLLPAAAAAQVRVDSPAQQAQPLDQRPGPRQVDDDDRGLRLLPHAAQREPGGAAVEPGAVGGDVPDLHEHDARRRPSGATGGSSKLCLSCHDGTIAIGNTVSSGQIAMQGVDAQGRLTGASVLGTDLRSITRSRSCR